MATRSEKTRAAFTLVGAGLFIVLIVAAIVVALVVVLHASAVGAPLIGLLVIGLLAYIAVKVSRRR